MFRCIVPLALSVVGCSASRTVDTMHGQGGACVVSSDTATEVELVVGRAVTLARPCDEGLPIRFAGPIRLAATEDGLQLVFDVDDAFFADAGTGVRARARDVASVFPEGEGPGKPDVDLALDRTDRGYHVDDTVPWETWGLRQPTGAFHLVTVMTGRTPDQTVISLRFALHVRVRAPD